MAVSDPGGQPSAVEEALRTLCGHLGPSLEQPCLWDPHGVPLSPRLLEEAMSGQYLSSDFSLPCPPGLEIPEEQHYTITANTLKVSLPAGQGDCRLEPKGETPSSAGGTAGVGTCLCDPPGAVPSLLGNGAGLWGG